MKRRELLRSWKLWAAAVAAGAGWPSLVRWLRPAPRAADAAWLDAGRFRDLPDDGWAALDLELRRRDRWRESVRRVKVYLRRSGEGVQALSPVCPHTGCLVRLDGEAFTCPCHRARYDLGGGLIEGPAPRDLDALPARVERGRVEVRYLDFRVGIADREPVSG